MAGRCHRGVLPPPTHPLAITPRKCRGAGHHWKALRDARHRGPLPPRGPLPAGRARGAPSRRGRASHGRGGCSCSRGGSRGHGDPRPPPQIPASRGGRQRGKDRRGHGRDICADAEDGASLALAAALELGLPPRRAASPASTPLLPSVCRQHPSPPNRCRWLVVPVQGCEVEHEVGRDQPPRTVHEVDPWQVAICHIAICFVTCHARRRVTAHRLARNGR